MLWSIEGSYARFAKPKGRIRNGVSGKEVAAYNGLHLSGVYFVLFFSAWVEEKYLKIKMAGASGSAMFTTVRTLHTMEIQSSIQNNSEICLHGYSFRQRD